MSCLNKVEFKVATGPTICQLRKNMSILFTTSLFKSLTGFSVSLTTLIGPEDPADEGTQTSRKWSQWYLCLSSAFPLTKSLSIDVSEPMSHDIRVHLTCHGGPSREASPWESEEDDSTMYVGSFTCERFTHDVPCDWNRARWFVSVYSICLN